MADPKSLLAAHPWHGVSPGDRAPSLLTAYVEIVPTDTVKYELDKASGLLKIDRVQRYSSLCPTLYGFVPRTYCGTSIAKRCEERTGKTGIAGDGDPLDICILSEKAIPNGGFLCTVKPIGGLRMIDKQEADDKIVAVLEGDVAFGALDAIADAPAGIIDRLRHYFLSYKQIPGPLATDEPRRVEIAEVYDRDEAEEVIRRSLADYLEKFG